MSDPPPTSPATRPAARRPVVLVLAAATGGLTGLGVVAFERVVREGLLERVLDRPPWVVAFVPTVGLLLAAAALRWIGRPSSPATTDEYLRAFHGQPSDLGLRATAARLVAAVATLGSGAPQGLEGPSAYLGAATGAGIASRARRALAGVDARTLLVAGAAAGVSAVFRAPATGVVFALEVPYRDDFARRMLLPALVASAAAYLTFVAIEGPRRLFTVHGSDARSLSVELGAIALGLAAGLAARAFAGLLRLAKRAGEVAPPVVRALTGGLAIGGLFAIGRALTGRSIVLGIGYATIGWARAPDRGVAVLLAVLVLRCLATSASVAGGGTGGLFVPLVVAGALLGRAAGALVGSHEDVLLVVGAASFLGAGYRVPLAGVVFVAETTGQAGAIVPALLASVAADLVMGRSSVTAYQAPGAGSG